MQLKKVEAYVRRHRLPYILMELDALDRFPGVSVLECQGLGPRNTPQPRKRIAEYLVEHDRHVKLEILCLPDAVKALASIIHAKAVENGEPGPRIFVTEASAIPGFE